MNCTLSFSFGRWSRSFFGGISTSGLMSHWPGSCSSPLYFEILRRSAEKNERVYKGKITAAIDPEKLKTLYLEMLSEVDCKMMLYTFAVDAICDGDKVLGAKVVNKSGMTLLLRGRNISGTHMAHSNFRVMPICVGIGEATGVAAALAVKTGKSLGRLDSNDIREKVGI